MVERSLIDFRAVATSLERQKDEVLQSLRDLMKSIANLPHEGTHSFPSSISEVVIRMGIGACFPQVLCLDLLRIGTDVSQRERVEKPFSTVASEVEKPLSPTPPAL